MPAVHEIIKAGGFTTGGFNFDTKIRRESIDPVDLFHAHIGGMDTVALAFINAAKLHESGVIRDFIAERYVGWNTELGEKILNGDYSLAQLSDWAVEQQIDPQHVSGKQEYLENIINRFAHA